MSSPVGDTISHFTATPAFKVFVIGVIILLLTIPLFMVWGLVMEREQNAQSVRRDVARSWGASQSVTGPFLVIPYTVQQITERNDKRIVRELVRYAVFLPEEFRVNGDVKSKVLKRSIYDVTVYRAALALSGRFAAPDMKRLAPDAVSVRWEDAVFALGLSNVSGLKDTADLVLGNGRRIAFEPSLGVQQGRRYSLRGIHARLFDGDAEAGGAGEIKAFKFDFNLGFSGSSSLEFSPAARETSVTIKSDWPHPSFTGSFLPLTREISDQGFTGSWQIPHLARSVPHSWTSAAAELAKFGQTMFGVKFYIPIDFYDLVNRSVKYGLMFLLVAFTSVFILELLSGIKFHAVQYVFVGLATIFFFVLLLSFSEHVGFALAYLIAAGATGSMLSFYVARAMKNMTKGLIMFGVFALLYGLLYFILTLEDYALLAGAVTGFVLITLTMFLTLGVNWSGRLGPGESSRQAAE